MEVELRRRNFRGEIKGISPGCVWAHPANGFRCREEEFGSKVSLPVTHSWLKWEQNQPQSSRNTHSWSKIEFIGGQMWTLLWGEGRHFRACKMGSVNQSNHLYSVYSVIPRVYLVQWIGITCAIFNCNSNTESNSKDASLYKEEEYCSPHPFLMLVCWNVAS